LRRAGVDITLPADAGLLGAQDEAHWRWAGAEKRVIVTDDTDFLVLAASNDEHPGVVYCRRTRHALGEIIRFLVLLHGVYEPKDMIGRVEFP
jgi:predicted nuclease of predicted toxin-antitoxin system